MATAEVNLFLSAMNKSNSKTRSKEELVTRAKHWLYVIESTNEHIDMLGRNLRRNARQNLRRLLTSHPWLLNDLHSSKAVLLDLRNPEVVPHGNHK